MGNVGWENDSWWLGIHIILCITTYDCPQKRILCNILQLFATYCRYNGRINHINTQFTSESVRVKVLRYTMTSYMMLYTIEYWYWYRFH